MDDKDDIIEEQNKIIEKQAEIIENMMGVINPVVEQLNGILETITKVNDVLGFTERSNQIRDLIKKHGWDYVSRLYHPDNNINDPAAYPMYALCKFIYDTMKQKGEI